MPNAAPNPCLLLHRTDNVAVALAKLSPGETCHFFRDADAIEFRVEESIRMGHKVAVQDLEQGTPIIKYGQVIGKATSRIQAGTWVHSHNLSHWESDSTLKGFEPENSGGDPTGLGPSLEGQPAKLDENAISPNIEGATFQGFRRASGKVGTRNYLAIISTVNCSASVAKSIARHFTRARLTAFPQIDGVVPFTHSTGCGMPFRGPSHEMLNRVLAGIAKHPNIGGFLIIGLGCEQNSLGELIGKHSLYSLGNTPSQNSNPELSPPIALTMQEEGGTRQTIERGIELIESMLPVVNEATREEVSARHLVVGTECGGSDGYSGITANPAVGVCSDLVITAGGTAILAETPEIYGAEHLLLARARNPQIAERLLEKIEWWKWYAGVFGGELDNNPSPGNKEGGLTTIAEKSLGAVAKGGSQPLEAVLDYAAEVTQPGFVFMDSPGFDPPSVTGMVAGGANMILFTTGRGSCFGCKPTPSIKVATNTPMYNKMIEDMDFDAGRVLAGATVAQLGEELFELILATASGRKTKSEAQNIGDEEFIPWTIGPVL